MSHRVVTDSSGAPWQIWAVRPTRRDGVRTLATEFQHGWLAFERLGGPGEKRRLAPIPDAWEDGAERDLLALLAAAVPVTYRSPAPEGSAPAGRGA
jgi:hypothetical protein